MRGRRNTSWSLLFFVWRVFRPTAAGTLARPTDKPGLPRHSGARLFWRCDSVAASRSIPTTPSNRSALAKLRPGGRSTIAPGHFSGTPNRGPDPKWAPALPNRGWGRRSKGSKGKGDPNKGSPPLFGHSAAAPPLTRITRAIGGSGGACVADRAAKLWRSKGSRRIAVGGRLYRARAAH
jgi:hypothetical protein